MTTIKIYDLVDRIENNEIIGKTKFEYGEENSFWFLKEKVEDVLIDYFTYKEGPVPRNLTKEGILLDFDENYDTSSQKIEKRIDRVEERSKDSKFSNWHNLFSRSYWSFDTIAPAFNTVGLVTAGIGALNYGFLHGENNLTSTAIITSVGFLGEVDKTPEPSIDELLTKITTEDLITFGMIPEFIGRIPVIAVLNELSEEDLVVILTEPRNAVLKQYIKLFELEKVKLQFMESAIKFIAEEAYNKGAGARGLRSMVEELMLKPMYKVPDEKGLKECIITASAIVNNDPVYVYGV